MSATTRYRIGERYWTVAQIAQEALITPAGVWDRIRRGVEGEALLARDRPKAMTVEERDIRARLRELARSKYRSVCPGCGRSFDVFQPAHILKTVRPGSP